MENKNPIISIIMPNYNGEKYIQQTIDSILNQTFQDFEFIIIDDCSTDNSVEIINSYQDDRIILLENEQNLGPSASRNKGHNIAKGKYIAIIDAVKGRLEFDQLIEAYV